MTIETSCNVNAPMYPPINKVSPMSLFRSLPLAAVALCLSTSALAAQGSTNTPPSFKTEFLGQFESSMEKFIALAKAMPADKYAWSPGPGVMTVARVYGHVARYNYYYPASSMGIAAPPSLGLDSLERMTRKAEIVALLEGSAAHVRASVGKLSDEQLAKSTTLYGRAVPQWSVLLQLVAHMNEHLGQSIAYARSNNVVPPWSQ
jgi:uncharacterized damage-inducible protein DinB